MDILKKSENKDQCASTEFWWDTQKSFVSLLYHIAKENSQFFISIWGIPSGVKCNFKRQRQQKFN